MPSTASTRLRVELQAQGENLNTWGDRLNSALQRLEEAIADVVPLALTGGAYSLTSTNYVADEARGAVLVLSGTLASNQTITAPTVEKLYLVVNNLVQGSYSATIKTAAGTGYVLKQGPQWVYCDGSDFQRGTPRLDQLPLPTAAVDFNGQNITNAGTGAFAGAVTIGGTATVATPTASGHATTKAYVDTFSADRSAGGYKLTNLGTPTASTDAATRSYVDAQAFAAAAGNLPGQSGNAGKVLTTDGSAVSWGSPYPTQTGNSGKVLTTDGTSVSWQAGLPAQAGNSGKYLTTDGSTATWSTVQTLGQFADVDEATAYSYALTQ